MQNQPYEEEPSAYTEGFLKQDYPRVLQSLQEDPTQATLVFGERNTTLLHAAAYDGQLSIVQKLISLGADLNVREISGRTPLHHAANHGHINVIDALVTAGANLEARDNTGYTPLMWAKISRAGSTEQKGDLVKKLLELGAREQAEGER
ncbi:Ankyrin repeat protein [Gimesia panareensis]|uniref:Ankyrin repeat protein n=1 Tax=Gimesia panareensis TaxID=2527978 RepID=A0A518FY55_9PLAN|nr:ankyrin repeat domain-containing protein [Gimesia panareensis]QDV21307.1 Ankyrin repeat protein [Gimesia panareensis]